MKLSKGTLTIVKTGNAELYAAHPGAPQLLYSDQA